MEGSLCADGSTTGFSITQREKAENLFIHFEGGGACWSRETCEAGTAAQLSAVPEEEGPYFELESKKKGWWDLSNPSNPIRENFNLVNVPYCTADTFAGKNKVNYGTDTDPYIIHHYGFANTRLILERVKKIFPNPQKILFYGQSAGGMGVSWNISQLKALYPWASIYVVNDGGLPYKPPYTDEDRIRNIHKSWGSDKTIPEILEEGELSITTRMFQYFLKNFPDVRYALVSSHKDVFMTYFAKLLGASDFATAVKNTMKDLADNEFTLSPNHHFFYLKDWWHVYFKLNPAEVISMGKTYSEWIEEMLSESPDWNNVRPEF